MTSHVGFVFSWLLFSAVPAMVANTKNRSWVAWYVISLLISPLISLIVLIAIGDKEEGGSDQ